jgi:hypothetical protein
MWTWIESGLLGKAAPIFADERLKWIALYFLGPYAGALSAGLVGFILWWIVERIRPSPSSSSPHGPSPVGAAAIISAGLGLLASVVVLGPKSLLAFAPIVYVMF